MPGIDSVVVEVEVECDQILTTARQQLLQQRGNLTEEREQQHSKQSPTTVQQATASPFFPW